MLLVDEILAEIDPLDPLRPFYEWDREFLREVGYLPDFSPFVRLEVRRKLAQRGYTPFSEFGFL